MELENASISIAAVRSVLENDGQNTAARSLKGLEVHTPLDATAAVKALQSVEAQSPESEAAIVFAMEACRRVGAVQAA